MKKKKKFCKLCEDWKMRNEFPKNKNGTGINSFCSVCKETYADSIFILNHGKDAIDAVSKETGDILIRTHIVSFQKGEYIANDGEEYLSLYKGNLSSLVPGEDSILAIGKYDEKRYALTREIAMQLVEEQAAVWESDSCIRHLFSGKELERMVVDRDKGTCHYCGSKGERIAFLVPRTDGGQLSPTNSVCCCETCKAKNGESLFIPRWLNVPVLARGEKPKKNGFCKMFDSKKQSHFHITKQLASQLIEEQMAKRIDAHHVQLLHDHREFRHFILERDHYTCVYCEKHGDTIDHVIPKALGGLTTPKNCICACSSCNEKKGHTLPDVFLRRNG